MAQIPSGYRLPGPEAAPGPHFALGRSSLAAHDRFTPQQLGVCILCTTNRTDRVPFRRYAPKIPAPGLGRLIWVPSGVVITMILGRYLLQRRYTTRQVVSTYSPQPLQTSDPLTRQLAVLLVCIGVSIASISASSSSNTSLNDVSATYYYGIVMLIVSLFATAFLGILQERTYKAYGSCWREGIFYTARQLIIHLLRSVADVDSSISSRCPFLYSSVTT